MADEEDLRRKDAHDRSWRIRFSADAFKREEANDSLGGVKRKYTEKLKELNSQVDVLDRYDRFGDLLIPSDAYESAVFENAEDGRQIAYGIERRDFHRDCDGVILPHQVASAKDFLKKLRGFGLLADVVGSGKTYEAGVVLSELSKRGIVSSLLLVVPDIVYENWISVLEKDFGLGKVEKGSADDDASLWEPISAALMDAEKRAVPDERPVVLHPVGPTLSESDFERRDGYLQPKYPMIVKSQDFIKWDENFLNDKLFSVVVVDEAHRLCNEDDISNERAMFLLSRIMEVKKRALRTYCLLLSATPHAGNLEDMFRLWYFIRCKGGNPEDFNHHGKHTASYDLEREYYLKDVCRGATTVMEFVIKEKIACMRGGRARFVKRFREFLTDGEFKWQEWELPRREGEKAMNAMIAGLGDYTGKGMEARLHELADHAMGIKTLREGLIDVFFALPENDGIRAYKDLRDYVVRFWNETKNPEFEGYRDRFEAYLKSCYPAEERNFDYLYEGRKHEIINEFLGRQQNADAHEAVKTAIAKGYHDGVMRTIMIRRPSAQVNKVQKGKKIVNFMFFRTRREEVSSRKKTALRMSLLGKDVTVNYDPKKMNWLEAPDAIALKGREELKYSLPSFVAQYHDTYRYGEAYEQAVTAILNYFGLNDEVNPDDRCKFKKQGSIGFYQKQLREIGREDGDVEYGLVPVYEGEGPVAEFDFKLEKLKQILRLHKDGRVIVFFDYNALDDERSYTFRDVHKALKSEFGGRLLDLATQSNGKEIKTAFDDDEKHGNAILVVADARFTEGANFQKCSVIVNFEVTPNPIGIQQSIGRVFRYGQQNDVVIYSLADMQDLEGYVLAYFTRIELMSDKNGEAEILAGCNNDNMVTVRCARCEKRMLYLSLLDYEILKKDKTSKVYCRCGNEYPDEEPKLMMPIGSQEYECDNKFGQYGGKPCHARFFRKKNRESKNEFYTCYGDGKSDVGVLEQPNVRKSVFACQKSCLVRHCSRFTGSGPLADKCVVMRMYRANPNESRLNLYNACKRCPQRKAKGPDQCFEECRLDSAPTLCKPRRCGYGGGISCEYAPQRLVFAEDWTAKCPCCRVGTLRPVRTKTFENYIRTAFAQVNGESFCEYFEKEIDKIVEVKEILKTDADHRDMAE